MTGIKYLFVFFLLNECCQLILRLLLYNIQSCTCPYQIVKPSVTVAQNLHSAQSWLSEMSPKFKCLFSNQEFTSHDLNYQMSFNFEQRLKHHVLSKCWFVIESCSTQIAREIPFLEFYGVELL